MISTVDPEARHGHKTSAHAFDGFKGRVAIDPDSEIITQIVVTPGNVGDARVAEELIICCAPRRFHYWASWRFPGLDSHRLADENFSLGYIMTTQLCSLSLRPSYWTHVDRG